MRQEVKAGFLEVYRLAWGMSHSTTGLSQNQGEDENQPSTHALWHMCAHAHTHKYIHTHAYIHKHTCIYTHINIYTLTHMTTYTVTHMNMHIHTYEYT